MKNFIVCTSSATGGAAGASAVERNTITNYLKAKGWSVWHWFEDTWLVVDQIGDSRPSELRDELRAIINAGTLILVMEIVPSSLLWFWKQEWLAVDVRKLGKIRIAERFIGSGASRADGAGRRRRVLPGVGVVSPGAALARLGEADLRALAAAIRSGRLGPPFGKSAVQRITGKSVAAAVADWTPRSPTRPPSKPTGT